MKQNGRGRAQSGGNDEVGLFRPGEVGMAALPELGGPHARAAQGAEQRKKKQNIGGKVHAVSEKLCCEGICAARARKTRSVSPEAGGGGGRVRQG